MATSQPLSECLIANGFPKNLNASDVANYFRATTGVPAVRLTLLPSGRWVFQVRSHSDRKKCLYNRTSCLKFEGQNYLITLNPPQVEDILDKWWSAPEPEVPDSGNLKSVSSDELFGSRNPNKQFVKVETSETTDGYVREPYSPSGVQSQMSPDLNSGLSESLQQVHPGKTYQYGMYPDLTHLQPQHVSYMLQMTSTSGGIRKSAGEDGYEFRHAGELPEHEEGDQKIVFADASFQGEDLISFDNNFHSDFDVLSLPLDSLSSEPRRQYFLRVTELPITANELHLLTYFEDRKNGGGPVLKIYLRVGAGEADIYFDDENIIQRVINKAPHLLMNKKIKVELVSESREHDKSQECCIVEVRSVPDEVMKEMCLLYFENPSKGGGDIEDSNWNEEEKVLYITFVDAAVAKQVTTRGHTVGGKVLEVTLYTPPPVVEDKGQCTLEVRGFDPQNLELYQLYFENPRKVAGTVTNFQVSEDNDVIYITFQTPEEAGQVAKATHKVGGKELQVSFAPLTSQPCTIKITKGDLQQLELYSLYFENPKKSGGGIIKETQVDDKEHAVYITFEDPETASMVCSRTHHVGNRDLEVTLYVPEKTMRQKSVEKTVKKQECQEEPLRTVEVNVGDNIQSEDTYIFYFEAKRHGGGDVEKVEIDQEKGLVCVTFVKPEVAARVASQQHKIAGQPVEVTLYEPPIPKPPYPDKLLFHNVAESTTRDCLAMYPERITGQEQTDLIYADEVGNVLAVFDEEPGGALGCITLGSAAPAGQFQAQSVSPLQNPATVGRGGAGALGFRPFRPPQFQSQPVLQVSNPATVGLAGEGHQPVRPSSSSSPPQGSPLQHKSRPAIRIISGEIAKASVDVIVSTVPPGLNMLKGVMSRSVLQHGGNSIQLQLQAYLMTHGCAQMGKVVCTSGGQLQCQYVYHLSLPDWQSDNGQTLKSAVKECLDTAKQHEARSIAFPTLGAGFLGYPLHRVAMILLNSIYSWVDRHRGCRLQEVQIIVFTKNTAGLQVFKAVQDSINDSKGLTRTGSGRQSSKQKQSSSPQVPQATSGNATGSVHTKDDQTSHWEPMNGDNIKLVDLDPSSTEYQQVVGLTRGMAVQKIQRVQNPTLYQQYRAKKRDIEMNNASNTANEQQMWHGTNAANISSIITNGFNRGYCGQNGTKFGHGVYFATNAGFSNSYTHSGTIFLALVLVGESTPGNSKLRVPPKKPGSDRLYDSLTGPDMVVIFHDAQAYPQYLLTLKTPRS